MKQTEWKMAVEEDPESKEIFLTFPDELLEEMNWQIGDTLIWTNNQDGSWTLSKTSV